MKIWIMEENIVNNVRFEVWEERVKFVFYEVVVSVFWCSFIFWVVYYGIFEVWGYVLKLLILVCFW